MTMSEQTETIERPSQDRDDYAYAGRIAHRVASDYDLDEHETKDMQNSIYYALRAVWAARDGIPF